MLTGPVGFDLAFSHWMQSFYPTWWVTLMQGMSFFAIPGYQIIVGVIIALWLWRIGQGRAAGLILFIISGLTLATIFKDIFARPRPSADLVSILDYESSWSFPSGHALGAVLLGGSIWAWAYAKHLAGRGLIAVTCLAYIILVGLSRIFLGAHWLSDVLGGYFFGMLWLVVVWAFERTTRLAKNGK